MSPVISAIIGPALFNGQLFLVELESHSVCVCVSYSTWESVFTISSCPNAIWSPFIDEINPWRRREKDISQKNGCREEASLKKCHSFLLETSWMHLLYPDRKSGLSSHMNRTGHVNCRKIDAQPMNNGTTTVASQNITQIRKCKHPVSRHLRKEKEMKETSNIINSVLAKVNM